MITAIKTSVERTEPGTYVEPCKCRKCQARFLPKQNQSSRLCARCIKEQQPSAADNCVHGKSLLDACPTCQSLYGSAHMRLKATAQKSTVKKITLTRIKPVR